MEKVIYRQVALPLRAFDYLKQFQRDHEAHHGQRLNNNQALALILADHRRTTEEREGRTHDRIDARS